jgi:lipopolysaccharide/colanic/teichoic acid biosynthesis glycosyltransferase
VVVSPTALSSQRLNALIRNLQQDDLHVHLATGVSGIDARRLRSLPLSHEPMLYVEAPSLSRLQRFIKRAFDLVVAFLILVFASPLLAIIALAVKLGDRGPVLFRQQRVGLDGATFDVLKFRTMRVDAEEQLAKLEAANERNGPLFKMERDPRVTRVGRFLRETSLDELPQLVNVLRGEMSLVGPRPGAAERGRAVRAGASPARAGAAGHHRAVAGGGARQPVVRGVPSPRPVLRRELVDHARPAHHAGHRGAPVGAAGLLVPPSARANHRSDRRATGPGIEPAA